MQVAAPVRRRVGGRVVWVGTCVVAVCLTACGARSCIRHHVKVVGM